MSEQVPLSEQELPSYLAALGLLSPGEATTVERAGDGNINWVRRVRSLARERSFIVKQARPALEKFPEYRVSTHRIVCEARWYESVAPFDRDAICPRVLHFDALRTALVLEDLGAAETLGSLLARGGDATRAASMLGAFLARVHAGTRDAALASRFENQEMRRLHGEHIFVLPFGPNDFPLSPTLRRRAQALIAEPELMQRIAAAYDRYQTSARSLVHADVQPSNVLIAASGPKLLDAEIAHMGDPAFDVGQLAGHFHLHAIARGANPDFIMEVFELWTAYAEAFGEARDAQIDQVFIYAGIEMLRRTLGAARVAEVARDEVGLRVIDVACRLILPRPGAPSLL
jgi:5-methylthioribose kinase